MNKPAIEGGNPVRQSFLIFGKPDIQQPEIDEVVDTLKSGWLSTGPKVAKFEQKFASFKKIRHAVGLYSCTSALHLGLNSLGLQPGDEVITTDFTFTASVSSIIHNGLVPVLVDVEPKTQNIDCTQIESKITPRTKVILPVHMCGYPCAMDKIMDIAKRYNLYVIEDCAHAIETTYKGKPAGTFGDMGAFSFYVTKNICTGEGGMLIARHGQYADRVRMMALHGMSKNAHDRFGNSGFKHYQVLEAGYKYNMTDITASMGIHQLKRIGVNWERRENIWNRYIKELSGLPIYLPPKIPKDIKHGYHLFTIQLKLGQINVNRDYVLNALTKEGIGTGVHYIGIHTHPYYRQTFNLSAEEFPNAQWLTDRTISLPLSSALSDQDVTDVIEALHKILEYYRK